MHRNIDLGPKVVFPPLALYVNEVNCHGWAVSEEMKRNSQMSHLNISVIHEGKTSSYPQINIANNCTK